MNGRPGNLRRNPFRVVDVGCLNPRVGSQARQPWAGGRNPFGIVARCLWNLRRNPFGIIARRTWPLGRNPLEIVARRFWALRRNAFGIVARWHQIQSAILLIGLMMTSVSAFSQFVLNPIAGVPGVSAGSVAWGDYDGDGRMDFLLSGSLQISLWHNTGSGFENVTTTVAPGLPGLYDSAVAWGDLDNDGRLDLLITGLTNFSGGAVAQVWRNTGNGFVNVPI